MIIFLSILLLLLASGSIWQTVKVARVVNDPILKHYTHVAPFQRLLKSWRRNVLFTVIVTGLLIYFW